MSEQLHAAATLWPWLLFAAAVMVVTFWLERREHRLRVQAEAERDVFEYELEARAAADARRRQARDRARRRRLAAKGVTVQLQVEDKATPVLRAAAEQVEATRQRRTSPVAEVPPQREAAE